MIFSDRKMTRHAIFAEKFSQPISQRHKYTKKKPKRVLKRALSELFRRFSSEDIEHANFFQVDIFSDDSAVRRYFLRFVKMHMLVRYRYSNVWVAFSVSQQFILRISKYEISRVGKSAPFETCKRE